MKMVMFLMEIVDELNGKYKIKISDNNKHGYIEFSPYDKELYFLDDNSLIKYLKENEYQLRKLLHNKRPSTYYIGFKLTFAFRDKKDVAAFNDRTKIVVLDKRNGKTDSYVVDKVEDNIYKMYTDGSFLEKKNKGAYALIIEDLGGNYKVYSEKVLQRGSSQVELIAAIKGLEILKDIDKIRIVTDSQYVRKGLTEWIMYWKLNGWRTANGEKVKNIENWILFDKLTEGKYIEFQWVKGHSNHFENTLCDIYAREAVRGKVHN
jgi:ribonuclease HI